MNERIKEIVTLINNSICDDSEDSLEVWNVITALRGPDFRGGPDFYRTGEDCIFKYSDKVIKDATTAVIRRALFANNEFVDDYAVVSADNPDKVKVRLWLSGCAYKNRQLTHFYEHSLNAFSALGLRWDTLNTQDEQDSVVKD